MNTRLKITLSIAAAGYLAGGLQAVIADSASAQPNHTVTRTVRFGDLDLASHGGKQALQERLRTAAGEVCNKTVGTHYGLFVEIAQCRSSLVEEAMTKVLGKGDIDAGELAATYKGGRITLAGGPAP